MLLAQVMFGLSIVCLMAGVAILIVPQALVKLNSVLNRTLTIFDQFLLRHRYLFGILLLIVSYLFFRLALLVPQLRG
jgi:hypothetical protein